FFGNTAAGGGGGGGIQNAGHSLIVTNSTFYGNAASGLQGGGAISVFTLPNQVTLENTIVAGTTSGGDCGYSGGAGLTDGGYNLDDDGTCGFSSANHSFSNDKSVTFTSTAPQSNGGPTATLALQFLVANHAIGGIPAGTNGCATSIAIDQRGVTRPGSV